jgi:Cft2 family RNA processing exonuclease
MRVEFTPEGIFLPQIRLWLDAAHDSETAWISHAHRAARGRVIATPETATLCRVQAFLPLAYGESAEWNGARLTAYPSGHMPGAAQLLIEYEGERVCYTGHVKLRPPLAGAPYKAVPCDRLIIEAAFGLPIFHFLSREQARVRIEQFAEECFEQKLKPLFLFDCPGPHGTVAGFGIPPRAAVAQRGRRAGKGFRAAYVSGHAALDNARARANAEELIPYSAHADFEELLAIVAASGAREVHAFDGHAEEFAHILRQRGIRAGA